MPVIGRLDSQVNDVLIEPVGRRRQPDGRDPRATSDESDDARPAATGEAREGVEGVHDRAREEARDDARRDERLPVWLL